MISLRRDNLLRAILLVPVALVSLGLTGCGLMQETRRVHFLAKRTTVIEPRFFDYWRSDKLAQREARMIAEQAWAQASVAAPNATPDYQNGFTEGFADFLYRGGTGEPPVIPPRGYWNLRFWNQIGKHSINDWYAGFRHGAQACQATGLRSMWLVPTSLLGGEEEEEQPQPLPEAPHVWTADEVPLMQGDPNLITSGESAPTLEDPESPPTPATPSDDDSSSDDSDDSSAVGSGTRSGADDDDSDADDSGADDDAQLGPAEKDPFDDDNPLGGLLGLEPSNGQGDGGTDELPPVLDAVPDPSTPDIDDIFGSPEDAFESSDSFEVDGLDFSFENRSRKYKQNSQAASSPELQIRDVRPAARIPSYMQQLLDDEPIVMTSGLYDEDLPLPPGEQSKSAKPPAMKLPTMKLPTAVKQIASTADTMVLEATHGDPAPKPPGSSKFNSTEFNSTEFSSPSSMLNVSPAPVVTPRSRDPLNSTLNLLRSSPQRSSPGPVLSPQDASKRDWPKTDVPRVSYLQTDTKAATPVDTANLKALPPMPLAVPESGQTIVEQASAEPITMWLHDDVPSEPVTSQREIAITNDDWDPFGEVSTGSQDLQPLRYHDTLQNAAMDRSTNWKPQRDEELPLRVQPKPKVLQAIPRAQKPQNQNVLQQANRQSVNGQPVQAGPQAVRFRTQQSQKIEQPLRITLGNDQQLPRIYTPKVQEPASDAESPLEWTFPN